ncbi:AraC family transcriptional regulator [Geodermatophilus sp. YIM 151500]|uniref:AraC family transcriptional regulator n=1 Tax=Geodermatophilus sp. YIM 151500 TaxID=2984531 RepID=UPI0021E3A6D2|nr:AraC family transcriptional regulator [Geodermatophilus sp. YIM 151500]MCV2490743.1 AraC family transcriptional regulator [Geodermatophilus sp. YIM 151500]
MLLLDTAGMTPDERIDGFRAAMGQASVPCRIEHLGPARDVAARMHLWQFGPANLFTADATGFRLVRTARHVRMEAPLVVALAVQPHGRGRFSQFGADHLVGPGDLMLSDLTAPYVFSWTGTGGSRAFQVPYEALGLPVDVVRAAGPRLRASPVHGLVQAHLRRMARSAAELADDAGAAALGTATVELVRALVVSAAADERRGRPVLAETLVSRVLAYARLHLTDPSLGPARLAAAHHVSVRKLYQECAAAGISLEQWIIDQRLELARAQLVAPLGRRRTIAAVARSCGFTDPSHFARRFRDAYGTTPREWRDAAGGA